ncbi:large conductance mechanosensitive channel protein MscL [Aerococcus urinaeequi]|uniref:Large-conductance mechanosensitive channel n=1 Tax=Aerococcus urinaeequi TaxID=51665 RepID=A0A7M1KT06_9LACT|nr:large conductance mechanosensitive channel protein MscL [Aerococcus urinaeequi]QOQ79312.1 large conductance mechanosensitive channel protein MscL [Aerococcus urinaeequi]WCG37915.1 large conductance mechanosensitive channel protein MscL [Aerococcus urinaeequi]
MLKEFRDFIAKGNVLDMAIGVVMATAFTTIVNSLVNDIIMPFVGLFLGSTDFASITVQLGSAVLTVGNFIQAVITFLIIALVLFFVMKAVASLKSQFEKEEDGVEDDEVALVDSQELLLTEIRDLLKEQNNN